jgi:hypothetical protein
MKQIFFSMNNELHLQQLSPKFCPHISICFASVTVAKTVSSVFSVIDRVLQPRI